METMPILLKVLAENLDNIIRSNLRPLLLASMF
ncbi:MAG: hypothetical protein CFH41_02195 [Alphaproteobacteria bacterium MarineAlpha11_Bin1]|nr:MAG: hypothetical protein CFH41_02195 [Alphaproteobacteria bacterium MarineAlpha11_Bin1]